MTRIYLLCLLLLVLTFNYSLGQTLNFDEPFGTQSWTEDGHPWSWDNTGWDNIRTYQPHTGTGHGMSAPGYHSKLSTDANINIQGIWLLTSSASDFTHLNLKGYNECGTLIYDVSLNPIDYEFGYGYVTLNWVGVKSFMVDYNSIDPLNFPVDLFYDDMDYSYVPVINVLNFDEPFGTQSWTEDAHPWSWDNTGWDNIRTYQPHTGTGHGMSADGFHSKLSTDAKINIQGIWLLTSSASDFTHLNLKGYNESGSLIYDASLNPMDYEFGYGYVTLNWVGVKSFMVDYNSIDPLNFPVDLFYDDMDYSYPSMATGTDMRTECNSYTWIDGNTYTASNNSATFNIVGGAANGCDSLVTLDLTILNSAAGTDTKTVCNSYTWIDGNTYTASNNSATFNIVGGAANGCDSLVTLDLTILNSATGTDTKTECNSYTWIDGNTYTASNNSAIFNIVGGAANGCDSLVTLDLTINSVSDLTTSTSGVTISANNTLATYQWLDCDNNNAVIASETQQSFTVTTNGNYAVELTENGCVDTSACVAITTVGIIENSFGDGLIVYPNPSSGDFSINLVTTYENIKIVITDISGKMIESKTTTQSQILNLCIKEPIGIYIVSIQAGNKSAVIRLVKE